jgi:glycerol-3-phosphate dehydrogenase subunit B
MRASSLAKHLLSNSSLQRVADEINRHAGNADVVLLPNVLADEDSYETLQSMVNKPLRQVATLPPAVAGNRMQSLLRHYFQMLGGTYLMGDTAVGGTLDGDRLVSITTAKLGDMPLKADEFVLATGSFISRGLVADYERVYEPILDLDVDADADREQWTRFGILEPQAYSRYGVKTNGDLRCIKQGKAIHNLRAIGSVLSGHDAIKMGDGTGVSLLTALAAAQSILEK